MLCVLGDDCDEKEEVTEVGELRVEPEEEEDEDDDEETVLALERGLC